MELAPLSISLNIHVNIPKYEFATIHPKYQDMFAEICIPSQAKG